MAYQTNSATDQTDLMSDLSTFAQANGFTEEYYNGTNRFLVLSRSADSLYVTFYWDGSDNIMMWQSLGYAGGYAETPWLQADDSGNPGSSKTYPDRGRNVNGIGNGTFTAYHFFAYTDPYVICVVLEYSPGLYRHFAFGKLNKVGTWTGGAFVAGHHWCPSASGIFLSNETSNYHSMLLEAQFNPSTYSDVLNAGATLHVEGLPGQDVSGKWGQFGYVSDGTYHPGEDTAGNPRIIINGGMRNGISVNTFGWLLPDLAAGFLPIMPIECFYWRYQGGSDGWHYLGNLANVGHIHLHGIDPAQELTVGSDTWMAFPAVRKSNIGGLNEESENMGLIYKKVT